MFHVKHPLTSVEFQALTGADASTVERLRILIELLRRWQGRINLIATSTLADPWRRHVLDSAQLVPLIPPATTHVIDIGSGAGFPGMIVAILSDAVVHLVESDGRKCEFLREAARITGTSVHIHNLRIENLAPFSVDVAIARACAPLPKLLEYAYPFVLSAGTCLFLKGSSASVELTESQKRWIMRCSPSVSRSDPTGVVLKVENLSPRFVDP